MRTHLSKKKRGNNASNNNIFPYYNKNNKSINNVIGEYENNELNIINHLNKENKKQNSKEKSGIIDKEGKDNIIDNKKLKTKKNEENLILDANINSFTNIDLKKKSKKRDLKANNFIDNKEKNELIFF